MRDVAHVHSNIDMCAPWAQLPEYFPLEGSIGSVPAPSGVARSQRGYKGPCWPRSPSVSFCRPRLKRGPRVGFGTDMCNIPFRKTVMEKLVIVFFFFECLHLSFPMWVTHKQLYRRWVWSSKTRWLQDHMAKADIVPHLLYNDIMNCEYVNQQPGCCPEYDLSWDVC